MGYCCALLLILAGFIKPRSKIVFYLDIFYMWALIALNTVSADYPAYEEMYLCCFAPRYALHEPFFMGLCRICLTAGLSYRQFRMIVALLIVLPIAGAVRKLTANTNYAMSLCIMFPFAAFASGLRNSVSASITIFCICSYLLSDRKNDEYRYLAGICLAVMFHYASVFYFLFVLVKLKTREIGKTLAAVVALFAVTVVTAQTGILQSIVVKLINSPKVLAWFSGGMIGFSVNYLLVLAGFMALIYLLRTGELYSAFPQQAGPARLPEQCRQAIRICCYSLVAVSGAVFSSVVFLRMLLPVLFVSYALFAESFSARDGDTLYIISEKESCRLVTIGLVGIFGIYIFGRWIGGDVFHIFQNNLLFLS